MSVSACFSSFQILALSPAAPAPPRKVRESPHADRGGAGPSLSPPVPSPGLARGLSRCLPAPRPGPAPSAAPAGHSLIPLRLASVSGRQLCVLGIGGDEDNATAILSGPVILELLT